MHYFVSTLCILNYADRAQLFPVSVSVLLGWLDIINACLIAGTGPHHTGLDLVVNTRPGLDLVVNTRPGLELKMLVIEERALK